jgi:predicted negative regulator of RcsB-dependent stress response
MDISERLGWIGLVVLLAGVAIAAWRANRRNYRQAADTHAQQYERFLRFLSMVRDAHR